MLSPIMRARLASNNAFPVFGEGRGDGNGRGNWKFDTDGRLKASKAGASMGNADGAVSVNTGTGLRAVATRTEFPGSAPSTGL
jgi:hypothetical protein